MSAIDRVRQLAEPIAADLDVELFDVEHAGGIVRVTLDAPGGVSLETIAEATRRMSRALDEHDPVPGRYTLEVSSPGLERPLRTPAHWRWAVGREVTVKVRPEVDGDRRVRGTVRAADDRGVVLALTEPIGAERRIELDEIDKARTVFEWGPTPKKGGKPGSKKAARSARSGGTPSRSRQGEDRTAEVETT